MDEVALRSLIPGVLGVLVRRGADFAAAEDAVQDALIEALRVWPADPPRDPRGWLVTVAWRRFLDVVRADAARRRREDLVDEEPPPGPVPAVDDTLRLYFLCAHPDLTPSSAIALTLRAVGGLTTEQIARAYLVPEATMAPRISRAKRTVAGTQLDTLGDITTVMRVLYLVFNEGYSGDVDLAAEAIRGSPGGSPPRSTTPRWPGCSRSCCCTTPAGPGGPRRTAAWCRWLSRTAAGGTPR